MDLFTKEDILPMELRFLPYDINSVLHFDQREYSRNGHRTIIIKDPNVKQNRIELTPTDLKKIEIIYGPQCRARDRQEKIELCQSYPGVARKKREVEYEHSIPSTKRKINEKELVNKSLRINPDITVPPTEEPVSDDFKDLNVDDAVQQIIENTYKISSAALKNVKEKYCNGSKPIQETKPSKVNDIPSADVLRVIEVVREYARGVVDIALQNITEFCEESDTKLYQRSCRWGGSRPCPERYNPTKSGLPRYSTQHRPRYYMSTKNYGNPYRQKHYGRSGNDTVDLPDSQRTKRDANNNTAILVTVSNDAEIINQPKDGEVTEHTAENKKITVSIIPNKNDRRSIREKKRNYYSDYDIEEQPKENQRDVDVVKPIKKIREYSNEAEVRKPVTAREVKKPMRRPKKNRHRPREEKRPRDVEEERPREREPRKRPRNQLTISVNRQRPMEIINEWKHEKKTRLKISKRPKQKKRPDNSMESYNDIPKKSKHGNALAEVDLPRTVKMSKANEEFYKERMWPEGTVWYMIQEDSNYDLDDMRRRLKEVNEILKRRTCVKLVEITPSQANKYEDYIVIDNSPDYVTGRVGGKQNFGSIELFRGDQHRQHAAMMVMAMLGFYFEVSRHDRDDYVRVHMRHVRPDKLHHFEKIRSDATLPLPYDYASATHPAWQFWRQLGHTGISTVATFKENDPDGTLMKSLGQNKKLLSDTDLVKINTVYGVDCFQPQRSEVKESLRMANGTLALPVV